MDSDSDARNLATNDVSGTAHPASIPADETWFSD